MKSIVDLHGGSAKIESEINRGTIVTLIFPGRVGPKKRRHSWGFSAKKFANHYKFVMIGLQPGTLHGGTQKTAADPLKSKAFVILADCRRREDS